MIIGKCPVCGADMRVGSDMTNADRIRAMSEEELARFFDLEAFLCPWCDVSCGGVEELPCRQCVLAWLKQEAET